MRFFRTLFMYLMNNERFINKLAESKPIRRAAQLVVYVLVRSGRLHGAPRSISNPRDFMKELKDIVQSFRDQQVKDSKKHQPK